MDFFYGFKISEKVSKVESFEERNLSSISIFFLAGQSLL